MSHLPVRRRTVEKTRRRLDRRQEKPVIGTEERRSGSDRRLADIPVEIDRRFYDRRGRPVPGRV